MWSVRSSKQFTLSKGQNKTPNEYHSGSDSPSHTAVVSCAYVITISQETAAFFSHPDFTVGFGILVCESPNQPFAASNQSRCAWVADFTAGWEFILIGLFCPIRSPCPEELFFIWFFTIIMYCYLFVNSKLNMIFLIILFPCFCITWNQTDFFQFVFL